MAEGDLERLIELFGEEPDEEELTAIRKRNMRALEGAALGSALLTLVLQKLHWQRDNWHRPNYAKEEWVQRPDLPEDLVHAIEDWSNGEYEHVRHFLVRTDGR